MAFSVRALILTATTASAHKCDSVLIKSIQQEQFGSARGLAAYHLIDEKAFDEMKKQESKQLDTTGKVLEYFKGDVKASATFSEFEQKRRQRLEANNHSENEWSSRQILREGLTGDKQITAWRDCMLDGGGVTLVVRAHSPTPESRDFACHRQATERCRWRSIVYRLRERNNRSNLRVLEDSVKIRTLHLSSS